MENQLTNFTIDNITNNRNDILNQFGIIEKAHVKAHDRKTKSGKLVQVKDYDDKRQTKDDKKYNTNKIVNLLINKMTSSSGGDNFYDKNAFKKVSSAEHKNLSAHLGEMIKNGLVLNKKNIESLSSNDEDEMEKFKKYKGYRGFNESLNSIYRKHFMD